MSFPVPDIVNVCIDNNCCECWKEGCGPCNAVFGACATVLEPISPVIEQFANIIWIFASPLAFPCIFFFPAEPHTNETSGYEISMLQAPCRRPCVCCLSTICLPCGQWYARYKVLGGDMTKYKLWQGYHDGPQCFARTCPGAPITIESGTYGEQDCPHAFLCLEVTCLGCFFSTCCAFDVSRRYQREERGLNLDPTEVRQQKCIGFFSKIMHACFQCGLCLCCAGCLVSTCAPDSAQAQEFGGEAGRAARACCRVAHIIWKGIIWTRVIGMGCMTAQMVHEAETPWDGKPKGKKPVMPPKPEKMKDRGLDLDEEDERTTKTEEEDEIVLEFDDMKMPWEEEAEKRIEKTTSKRNERRNRGAGESKQEE